MTILVVVVLLLAGLALLAAPVKGPNTAVSYTVSALVGGSFGISLGAMIVAWFASRKYGVPNELAKPLAIWFLISFLYGVYFYASLQYWSRRRRSRE